MGYLLIAIFVIWMIASVIKGITALIDVVNKSTKNAHENIDGRRGKLLSEDRFIWPHTIAEPGKRHMKYLNAPEEGLLKYLGYKVGVSGLSTSRRHAILEKALQWDVPNSCGAEMQEEWGAASTCRRLKKLSYTIASFVKLKKRMKSRDRYSQAIRDWEDDLSWLKEQYYAPCQPRFTWPRTDV